MTLKVFSQDAEVCLRHNIPREDAEQEEEEEEMAASQVRVLSQIWGCVCFSSGNAWTTNLQTFSSLLLTFLPGCLLSTSLFFPFLLIIVKPGSLEHFSLVSQNLVSLVCILAFYGA